MLEPPLSSTTWSSCGELPHKTTSLQPQGPSSPHPDVPPCCVSSTCCNRDEDQYLLRHSSPITDREPAGSQQVPGSLPMDDKGELERILAHLEDENRWTALKVGALSQPPGGLQKGDGGADPGCPAGSCRES